MYGSIKTLNIKAVADIFGHTTAEITERYCVKKDTSRLTEITDGFEIGGNNPSVKPSVSQLPLHSVAQKYTLRIETQGVSNFDIQ